MYKIYKICFAYNSHRIAYEYNNNKTIKNITKDLSLSEIENSFVLIYLIVTKKEFRF